MHEYFALTMTADLTSLNERFSQGWTIDRVMETQGGLSVVILTRYHPQNRASQQEQGHTTPAVRSGMSVNRMY